MIPNKSAFISRVHFLIQLLISQTLFSVLFLLTGNRELETNRESSLVFFAIGILGLAFTHFAEFLTREASERSLSGIGKARKTAICYRQMVFIMSAIFALLIFCNDHLASNLLFPLFAVAGSLWLVWSNLVGYRILHRRLYRTTQAAKCAGETEAASLPTLSWRPLVTRR